MKNIKFYIALVLCLGLLLTPLHAEEKQTDDAMTTLIDDLINAEILFGLSGAQLVVLQDGHVIKNTAYGYTNAYENVFDENNKSILDQYEIIPIKDRTKVNEETLFDLASNTKMYAANYAIQKMFSDDLLTLETRIVDIYPDYTYQGIGVDGQTDLTIAHLLRHDSGFIASPKYHDNTFLNNLGNGENEENYLYSQTEAEMLEKLLMTPLEFTPGEKVRYSDVDFMLLGKVVETLSGQSFDSYLYDNFYNPLGLNSIVFNPLSHGFLPAQIASTELHGNTRDGRVTFNNFRDTVLTGEVHDEKAWHSFEGVAGHAGLYGNASDIASLAQLMLEEGARNGTQFFSQDSIDQFSTPSPLNDTYAYGWRRQGDNKDYGWAFSKHASPNTLGHTGWTGTLTMIDPETRMVIVLLTNARNSPIMGPDKNDFYTKSFRTNDYGTITTLVYESMGLGDHLSSSEFLINLIIQELGIDKNTISNRNELRSLVSILSKYAITDSHARDYLLENKSLLLLNDTFEQDTKHLDTAPFTTVDKSELSSVLDSLHEEDAFAQLGRFVFDNPTSTQELIDELAQAIPSQPDRSLITTLIETLDGLDPLHYEVDSFTAFTTSFELMKQELSNPNLSQMELDRLYAELIDLRNQLKLVSEDVPVKEVPTGQLPATGQPKSTRVSQGLAFILVGSLFIFLNKKNVSVDN